VWTERKRWWRFVMVFLGCEERNFIEEREKKVSNVVLGFMVGWLSFSWWSMVRKDKEKEEVRVIDDELRERFNGGSQ
jgi:hypothetical protein